MIVTMRQDIQPLCTIHRFPMALAQFGDPAALMVKAYKCDEAGCTRAYNTSLGYFDILQGRFLADKEQQNCRADGNHMFLEKVYGDTETWSCGQVGCDYKQNFAELRPPA
jgi:hypothetical protein